MNNKITILLVDDDADDISLFLDAIKEIDASISCITAFDGKEAMELLALPTTIKPDFIFLDLNMPRLNGKQCLVHLKNNKGLADIPVAICSTSKLKEDMEETKKLGAVAFFSKPSKFHQLINIIENMLDTHCPSFHSSKVS